MRVYRKLSFTPKNFRAPIVTWGIFDGMHRGHRKLLGELISWARAEGSDAVVMTLDRHPSITLTGQATALLTSLEHRLVLFERAGIDAAVVLAFTKTFSQQPPVEFLEKVLWRRLAVRGILAGYDTMFGKDRQGNVAMLKRWGKERGVTVRSCPPALFRGQPVSSTAIREAIGEGRLAEASGMLGQPVSLWGTVVRGAGRGQKLGFPTANLDLHGEVRPPGGVYATRARLAGGRYLSMTNIGVRPTFGNPGEFEEVVEVHLLGFQGKLYGHPVELEFLARLRDEKRFATPAELRLQLERDREEVLRRFGPARRK